MRALKYAGAAVAALVLILVLLLIVGMPSGFLTSTIQDRVERATGYRLTIAGTTKISFWPTLNVTLSDLTLQDPKDRDGANRVTVGRVQADMTLSSIWSGRPKVSELVITKPVLYRPLLRERNRPVASSRPAASSNDEDAVTIDRVSIVDGAVRLSNLQDHVERHVDNINAKATIGADSNLHMTGSARAGDNPLTFDIKATLPSSPAEHQNIPVELSLDAKSLLSSPLTAKAEVRTNGPLLMINSITGNIGDGAFNGFATVDLASKPLVKLDLDFQRLDIVTSNASTSSASDTWSDEPMDLNGLNYVDAQLKISAAQVNYGNSHFAPVAVDATLADGVMKASVSNLGTYGAFANGELIVDASSGNPTYAMHCDIVGVRALPLLTSLADFDKIDGQMQAKIAARSSGASQHAIMSNMSGTVFANFQDGQIRGVNVAQMIRELTSSVLSGWQEQRNQGSGTDLTQLSASFKIDRGQAQTTDLNLVGPLVKVTGAGTIDLGTKMIGFRVEPKLVMTTEGQGRTTDPVGLGIPVMISGPWSSPKIYPDMQGVLDNPDAAYAKLKQMGQGLFGSAGANLGNLNLGGLLGGLTGGGNSGANNNSPGSGSSGGNSDQFGGLGQTLGNLIQQGLGGQGLGGMGGGGGSSTGGRSGRR
ncbi:MAG: AsmA family protein, partial [Acetobacteraceae bacterium]|nr:AsmA family protein [Acetobacteraceae bacterium]